MEVLRGAYSYILDNPDRFRAAIEVHVKLSFAALLIAIMVYVPIGVMAAQNRRIGEPFVGVLSASRVVPSLAVIFLLFPYRREIGDALPFADRSFALALVALLLLAGPPIVINTEAGLTGVDPAILENARSLGMRPDQVFSRVQLPLALPVIVSGIRTATVEVIASATLAAFIGAGGLGTFILSGLTLVDWRLLLVGAIPVTVMALGAEISLSAIERWLTPPGAARVGSP